MDNTESTNESSTPAKSGGSKNVLLIVVVLILLALGVGAYMLMGKSTTKQTSSQKTAQGAVSPTSGSVIASIKEALASSASLQCDYTDDDGRKIVSYMKAGAIRSDITASDPKQSGSMIMKGKKMYYWSGKTGTMMEFDIQAMMEKITPSEPKGTPSVSQKPEDLVANLEKFKKYCKPAVVSDSLFVPPTDVKFTDMSEMMKAAQKSSGPTTGVMTEEQIKELQTKYQQ